MVLGCPLAKCSFTTLFVSLIGLTVPINFVAMTRDALAKTTMKPAYNCLFSQVPIFAFYAATYCLFTQTEWAFKHPALATLVLVPGYSLICSRQIICNVTFMDIATVPKVFLWFLLFPLNR